MASAGEMADSFSFMFIPAAYTSAVSVHHASKSGGLEQDALRLQAEAHFAAGTTSEFREQHDKAVNDMLMAKGVAPTSFPGLAASVEIVVLQLPCADNGFVGVSLYCDQSGKLKNFELNTRATSLVQACAHANQIFGDAFIGRYHDDESLPWERLDFGIQDMNSDAAWALDAKSRNEGKRMGSYSTSGVLQNMLRNDHTAVADDTPKSVPLRTDYAEERRLTDSLTWTQNAEELELKLTIPRSVNKADLRVKFNTKRLQIEVKNDPSLAESNTVFSAAGAALWGSVDVDCCAWTLERMDNSVVVVCTLCKASEASWPQVFA